jgi:hypothetical protein
MYAIVFYTLLPCIVLALQCAETEPAKVANSTPDILLETPIQKQYHELLIAYQKTIGQKGSTNTNQKAKKKTTGKEKVSFGSLSLPQQTQMEMALELMARLDQPTYNSEDRALFAADTWQSLRLVDQEPSALSGIAPNMNTIFGKLFLARMLTTPTTDLERIETRQNAIKELCEDQLKTKEITKICASVKKVQEHILGLTNTEHPLYQKGLRIYLHDFFMRPVAKENKGWNRFSKLFGDVWYAAGPPLAILGLWSIWKKYKKETPGLWIGTNSIPKNFTDFAQLPVFTNQRDKKSTIQRSTELLPKRLDTAIQEANKSYDTVNSKTPTKYLPFLSIRQNRHRNKLNAANLKAQNLTALKSNSDPVENDFVNAGFSKKSIEERYNLDYRTIGALLTLITAYNGGIQVPGIMTWIRNRFRAANYFYDQLRALRTFFMATQHLKEILETTTALKKVSDEFDTVLMLNNPDVIKLRNLLMGPAFKNRALGHVLGGDAILAVDLLGKCKDIVLKGIGLLGAMDNYSSLAQWYTNLHASTTHPLCFAQLVKAPDPSIHITNFWHVLVRKEPHLNSIKLGAGSPKNAVVFGVFESGKTMILQAVALNIVCAQSIGICLAQSMQATPFASINIYANIKDDLASGRSLFRTELYRAQQLLDQIKQMNAGQFSFTIADATFTGTEAGAGQAAAYAVARFLGNMPQSIAIHATNFASLSILGNQNPQVFANYHLPTKLDNLVKESSYTLTPGTFDPTHATAIFKEEKLPASMIAEMEKYLAHTL